MRGGQVGVPLENLMGRLAGIREQMGSAEVAQGDGHARGTDDIGIGDGTGSMETLENVRVKISSLVGGSEMALRANMAGGDVARHASQASPLALRLLDCTHALHEEVQARLKRAADAHRVAAAASWRTWVTENIAHGARNAHRFLRLHTDWRPTTALNVDGITTADPRQLLDGYVRKHDKLWNGPNGQTRRSQEGRGPEHGGEAQHVKPWRTTRTSPLQRPTPAQRRAASMIFSPVTTVAFDGFALRHYSMMSDEALGYVADFFGVLEVTGELPPQFCVTAMPLYGHRAVASLVGLYRLWARLRKPIVGEWESRHERPYLAAGKGKSPQATVWRQASRAEAAVGKGLCSGTLL